MLDAAGQLVGFWAAEHLQRGFVVFPYRLEQLRIFGPNRPAGANLDCRVDLQMAGNELMRSDIEIAGADGRAWMQLQGWADRRFDPPKRFHAAWIAPREVMLSEPWRPSMTPLWGSGTFECFRLESLFQPGAALWKDLWASLILTPQERKNFASRKATEHRQIEWLSGRAVAKDAIRSFLGKHYGLELLPADIEITQDEYGKPMAAGPWIRHLRAVPEFSLAHSEGLAVAVVGDGGNGRHLGIDIQAIRELKPDFETLMLTADERQLLDAVPSSIRTEWLLRLWCVKEAISKAIGRGLIEGPASVRVSTLDAKTGIVEAMPQGKLAEAVKDAQNKDLRAYTAREGAYVAAIAIYEKRTS